MLVGTIQIAMTTRLTTLKKGLDVGRNLLSSFGTQIMASAKLAEEFEEAVDRLAVVFPTTSDAVVASAQKMADAFGVSKIAFVSAAEKLGGVFKAAGVGEDESEQMTESLMTLAKAMSLFSHIPIEQAIGKIKAGLAGKGKVLSEYGIGINDAKTKTEAYADGMVAVGGKLDTTSKVMARFNIMMKEGAGVIDQMGSRVNDRANSWSEFLGRIENIREEFGEKLPAPVESFFAQLNVGLVAGMTAWNDWSNQVVTGQNDLADFGQSGAQSMGMVQQAVGGLANSWQLLTGAFKLVQIGFNSVLMFIVKGMGWVGEKVDWLVNKLGMASDPSTEFYKAFGDNLQDTVSTEIASLKDEWAKPWASEGIDASFDAARKKLHDLRTDLQASAKTAHIMGPNAPSAVPSTTKGHFKFAEAALEGSKEAFSIIAHSKFGNFDLTGKIAGNSDKTVELLEDIRDHLFTVAENSDNSDVTPLSD